MRSALCIIAIACGCGGPKPVEQPRDEAGDALLAAAGNAQALRALMRDEVLIGGLWFADADCAKQFAAASKLGPDRFDALAKCLATLKLAASPRHEPLPDATLVTYEPGIELEARVAREPGGARLASIGYESRLDAASAPTVSPEALETVRTAGDRDGPLDEAAAGSLARVDTSRVAEVWLTVCIDATGAVTGVHAHQASSYEAARVFGAAAHAWTFVPFVIAGQASPVCSLVHMMSPRSLTARELLPYLAPTPDGTLMFSSGALEPNRLAGEKVITPDDQTKVLIDQKGIGRVSGSALFCLDEQGHIANTRMVHSTGLPAYDQRIVESIKGWSYKPYVEDGKPRAACSAITFIYSQH